MDQQTTDKLKQIEKLKNFIKDIEFALEHKGTGNINGEFFMIRTANIGEDANNFLLQKAREFHQSAHAKAEAELKQLLGL